MKLRSPPTLYHPGKFLKTNGTRNLFASNDEPRRPGDKERASGAISLERTTGRVPQGRSFPCWTRCGGWRDSNLTQHFLQPFGNGGHACPGFFENKLFLRAQLGLRRVDSKKNIHSARPAQWKMFVRNDPVIFALYTCKPSNLPYAAPLWGTPAQRNCIRRIA